MASAFKRGGRWYARWKDGTGKRQSKVTTCRTKAEAKRLAEELEQRGERQRLGLEPLHRSPAGWTVGDLMRWWLDRYARHLVSYPETEIQVRLHILERPIAATPLGQASTTAISSHLQDLAGPLSPATINHVRKHLHTAFSKARDAGIWIGVNPVTKVARRKVPRRTPDYLRPDEARRLLEELAPEYQAVFATAIYAGLRKGELAGLRRGDVDLEGGWLHVRRSYDRDTTKGGHGDTIPINDELLPWLRRAIAESPSDLVFPAAGGGMRPRTWKPEAIFRRALARAGIADGWSHRCRRRRDGEACGYQVDALDREPRRCPSCGMKLWPVPKWRRIRFHDLRHTAVTLLLEAGADLAAVARIARHSDPRITMEVYGHLGDEYLRAAANRLRLNRCPSGVQAPPEPDPPAVEGIENAWRALEDSNLRPMASKATVIDWQEVAGRGKASKKRGSGGDSGAA